MKLYGIFAIVSVLFLSCFGCESKHGTVVIDLNGTTWCSYSDDGKPSILLYFKDGYYMEMFSSLKGDFSMPSERIKYKLSIKDNSIHIIPISSPKLPPFIVRENGSYLDETWPIGQGKTIYKKISEHNANKLLKDFNLSAINVSKLKIRKFSAQ